MKARFKGYEIEIFTFEGKFSWVVTDPDGAESHAIDDLEGTMHKTEKGAYQEACRFIDTDIQNEEYKAMKLEGRA
jgi:hypothetical protein